MSPKVHTSPNIRTLLREKHREILPLHLLAFNLFIIKINVLVFYVHESLETENYKGKRRHLWVETLSAKEGKTWHYANKRPELSNELARSQT